jgi:serine protease Do
MRKLGTWGRSGVAAVLLLAGLSGPAGAQDGGVPWLGVVTQSLSDELREGMDYRGEGVLVSRVVDEGPADRAGVRRGDVLVSVDGRSVRSPEHLTRTIRGARVGQSLSLVVVRDDRRRNLTVRLGQRPDEVPAPRAEPDVLERVPGDLELETLPRMRRDGDGTGLVMRAMGRGRLGVRVENLNQDLGSYFDVPDGSGALVLEVLKDTPAEKAGLKAGDVITRVGDRKVSDADDLVEALRDQPAGRVAVTVTRRGQERTVEAELAAPPRALRVGPGRDLMMLRPRDRRVVPPRAVEPRRSLRDDDAMQDELRRMREELRELRQKLDRLEAQDDAEDDG